jgi:hypothetical protein
MPEAMFTLFVYLPVYIGVLFTLMSLWERLYLDDEERLFGSAVRKGIVLSGAVAILPIIALTAWSILHLARRISGTEGSYFIAYVLALASTFFVPLAVGGALAGTTRRMSERGHTGRGLLAVNWLGVGATHGIWAFPIAFIAYVIVR